jgi:transglutaminase-like putative cysteine protease
LGALLAAVGIPSRLLVGWLVGYRACAMHAWLECALPDGRWLPLDPANHHLARAGRDVKSGRFGFVGSDRVVFSVGADLTLTVGAVAAAVPILQHPVVVNPPGGQVVGIARVVTLPG